MPTKTKSRNKKFVCELHLTFEMVYNPESKAFKDSLRSYRQNINKSGDEQKMLEHVAFHLNRFGIYDMIEGVGYVSSNGKKPFNCTPDTFSGINILHKEPDPEIDVISNDYI